MFASLPKHDAMNVHLGFGGISPHFLEFGSGCE
jgi:hypothetical protein